MESQDHVSRGPGQRHHLDGQEFREQRKKDGFLTVPHLLSTTLNAAPQFPALTPIFHADLGNRQDEAALGVATLPSHPFPVQPHTSY